MIPRIFMTNKNLFAPFYTIPYYKADNNFLIKIKAKYHPSQGDVASLWYQTNLFRNKNFETIPLRC